MDTPKISVIIPMYNVEKYIRQCLISVLASKFKDYEVLVIDDCSKDNSVAEVEKLLSHFDGRLKVLSTEKNSGGAGIPRNIGIKNAAGKYISFVDSDDFILPTALGDFFELAEKFQADVVHTEKQLIFNDTGKNNFKWEELTLQKYEAGDCVEEPTFEPELGERIRRYAEGRFLWVPWGKLFRRDLILENKIDFPRMKTSSDMVFCFKCMCCAKNYLRIPNVTNIYRILKTSTSRKIFTSREGVNVWLSVVTIGLGSINGFMNEQKFFQQNPNSRREVLKFFIEKHFGMIKNLFQGVEPYEVQEIFYDELQNSEHDSKVKNLVSAYLYTERALMR